MNDIFSNATISHVTGNPTPGASATSVLTADDFSTATREISSWKGYEPTPLHSLKVLARDLGIQNICYKDEGPRFGLSSFKALGGAYAGLRALQRELETRLGRTVELAEIHQGSLADEVKQITLVCATDGNHGRSLAWGAQTFGAACRIYIHKEVSESRAQSIRDLGAEVIRVEGDYDASVDQARRDADSHDWFVVSDTSWEGYLHPPKDVMSGYGVMVDEIVDQQDTIPTHLFVQGGVGGLAAAVSARLRQACGNDFRVVVVEPDLAACLFESGKSGTPTAVQIYEETLMAGLSCGEPSALAWDILKNEVHNFLSIPESLVGPSMRLLGKPNGDDPAIVAGESAICGLAGLIGACQQTALREALGLTADSVVLLIGSEGATDPDIYAHLVGEEA